MDYGLSALGLSTLGLSALGLSEPEFSKFLVD
jgi:hypothetical protein